MEGDLGKVGYVIVSDKGRASWSYTRAARAAKSQFPCDFDVLTGDLPIFQVSKSKANQLFLTSVSSRLTGDEELT